MKGQTVLLEHVFLTAGTFLIFIMIVISFSGINQYFQLRKTNEVLGVLAEQTAVAIVTAYEEGQAFNASSEPVITIYLDFPRDLSGRPYEITFEEDTKTLLALSGQTRARSDLLGIPDRVEIDGKITASSGSAYVSYYRSSDRILIGVEWR